MRESAGIRKAIVYISRLLLVIAAVALALPISFPIAVQAATNPIDLKLDGEGATPWSIADIQPGENGTKIVALRNVGSQDGFVTIWLNDIDSSEGTSPEFATGNATEPSDLLDSLRLGLSGNGTGVNIPLPTTVNNFPRSALDPKYIEVIPLKAGDTVNLTWAWNLPPQTGNEAQGDSISFTINYLLRESEIADVSTIVTNTGVFTENVTANCTSGEGEVTVEKDTIGKTEEGEPLSEIWIIDIYKETLAPSPAKTTIGPQYDVGPHGATFDRPVSLTLAYDPAILPTGTRAEDLVIARLDENTNNWIELQGSNVDTANNTISVPVSHFSRYTIVAPVPYLPPSPPPAMGQLIVGGTPRAILETDVLGEKKKVEIRADGTLLKPLKLTSPDDRFVIEVDSYSKITSLDGMPITRLELSLSKETINLPDDIVTLSSVYKITGYTHEQETSQITFSSPARVTILYDPKSLPENVFPPFVAYYTIEGGLESLELPPDAAVEIGKVKAEITHASLFFAAAKLVPPPMPLPAHFKASNLTINPAQARLGRPVSISVDITNDGGVTGSYELYLVIDGIVRSIKEITIESQNTTKVSFAVANLAAGEHQIKIAGLTGKFRVTSVVIVPAGAMIDWQLIDLSIFAIVVAGLLTTYIIVRKSHQSQIK